MHRPCCGHRYVAAIAGCESRDVRVSECAGINVRERASCGVACKALYSSCSAVTTYTLSSAACAGAMVFNWERGGGERAKGRHGMARERARARLRLFDGSHLGVVDQVLLDGGHVARALRDVVCGVRAHSGLSHESVSEGGVSP